MHGSLSLFSNSTNFPIFLDHKDTAKRPQRDHKETAKTLQANHKGTKKNFQIIFYCISEGCSTHIYIQH